MKRASFSSVPGKSLAAALLAIGGGLASLPVQASLPSPVAAVGTVTLSLGKALIIDAAGTAQTVRRGSTIRPGDRVETAQGGHVHIRFVDGALVSVRPTSRLVVEDYQYNAQHVEQSLVRFRLDQGTARAISGAAAEGAKERFRLNTPLVAIGVRGTDFLVRTDAEQTLASVNQGAIVMAPFDTLCQPQDTGPCGSDSARLLSASMGDMLMEYRQQLAGPQFRPLEHSPTVLAQNNDKGTTVSAPAQGSTALPLRETYNDTQKNVTNDTAVVAVLMQEAVTQAEETAKEQPPFKPEPQPEPSPPIPEPEPPLPAQLAWGRWGAASDGDMSLTKEQAREGRKVTVGLNNYMLYRNEDTLSQISPQLGRLGFSLEQSHAQFTAANGAVQPAAVTAGHLTLDFAARQFSTALDLTSVATGAVALQASGSINTKGYFFDRSVAGQVVTGAAAFDGQSAGYAFDKAAAGGTLSGITLWGR